MNRTRGVLAALAIFAAGLEPAAADHVPVAPPAPLELQARTALLLDFGTIDGLAELVGAWQGPEREFRYRALSLGGYYRLHKNLKAGLFYRLQSGVRHDDDWMALNPGWGWRDTRDRLEQVLIADLSPRFGLELLPGRDWVFMFKARYFFNTFNSQQSLLLKPGLTWFLIVDRQPLLNLSLSYEAYLPLNFSGSLIYQHYPYLNAIFHLHPNMMLELGGAWKSTVWNTSSDVKNSGQPGYSVEARSWVVSAGAIFSLAP